VDVRVDEPRKDRELSRVDERSSLGDVFESADLRDATGARRS